MCTTYLLHLCWHWLYSATHHQFSLLRLEQEALCLEPTSLMFKTGFIMLNDLLLQGVEVQLQKAKQELANEQEANERLHAKLAAETDKCKVLEDEAEMLKEAASAAERNQEEAMQVAAQLLNDLEAARNEVFPLLRDLEEAKMKHAEADMELRRQLRQEMQEKIVQLEVRTFVLAQYTGLQHWKLSLRTTEVIICMLLHSTSAPLYGLSGPLENCRQGARRMMFQGHSIDLLMFVPNTQIQQCTSGAAAVHRQTTQWSGRCWRVSWSVRART